MQGMKISDVDLVKLLPQFIREDEASNGIAAGVNQFAKDLIQYSPLLKKWDQIDSMDDAQLNELAWELAVLWYDHGANIETKRRLIKNSDKVYSSLGTKWAVEEVVSSYLGPGAQVLEWFDYGGRPHYFKIVFNSACISQEAVVRFLGTLQQVKRKSSWLEEIIRKAHVSTNIYLAAITHTQTTHYAPIPRRHSIKITAHPQIGIIHPTFYRSKAGGVMNYG